MFEYVGSLHIHTNYSDGTGTIKEIAGYANEVGLDFVAVTDHNTLRAKEEKEDGWYGDSFVMVGCEINDKKNLNHYLAFDIKEAFSTRLPAKEYVQRVNEAGGIGFIAHPHEKRDSMKEHPPYPWVEWDAENFTGIEIWNHMSEWMEGLTEQNKYNYFVHPLSSIVSPPKETLEVWDKLNLERRVVGIGGIDAHAHKLNLLGFFEVEVFPYKVLFKSVRTHILTKGKLNKKEKEITQKKIIESLKEGRCFVSNYYHGDAKGFRFFAVKGEKKFHMGENIPLEEEIRLKVLLPNISGVIKLIRNGKEIDSVENAEAEFVVKKKGAYRIEVFKEDKAWIYSNHIRIGL